MLFRNCKLLGQLNFFSKLQETRAFASKVARNRVVLISTSNSIFENLALEEWMYEKTDFTDTDYLLLWKNQPTIVFGRHQNPWLEANIPQAFADGVDIARRSSGGGTVYHDEGNLNLSFLKSRDRYNRKENLNLVVDALKQRWDIDLMVNERDDIMLDRFYKVSGTAAKLGRVQSYHHFTLLHNVDQRRLQQYLESPMKGVDSKATKSFPATVRNLSENAPNMNFELLVEVIGHHFLQEIKQQVSAESYRQVNPLNEAKFPGVLDNLHRLKSWEWIYGKTPKFSIHRSFVGKPFDDKDRTCSLEINISVEKGAVVSLTVSCDNSELADLVTLVNEFYSESVNLRLLPENIILFQKKCMQHMETNMTKGSDDSELAAKWILECISLCFRFL